jgi:hypothetical protein
MVFIAYFLKEDFEWKSSIRYVFIVVNPFPSGKVSDAIAGIATN